MADETSSPSFDPQPFPSTVAPETEDLRRRVLAWLETMRMSGHIGQFRLNHGSDATVFASCFAVFLRHLFDDLKNLDAEERLSWLGWLQGFQDQTSGLFVDPESVSRTPDRLHDPDHLNQQLTTFCLSAIHALGGRPLYPLRFLEAWKPKDKLIAWLNSLDWHNSWNSGNKAMFMGIFLIYDGIQGGAPMSLQALEAWFDWHDQHQNPETGFWGAGQRAHYIDGMGGAYHQYLIYNYMKRPINYAERIVDRTLFLQQPDGTYSPFQGGMTCYEMDAVDILVQMYLRNDYRREDIRVALRRVLMGTLRTQNPDGGFCWGRYRPWNLQEYRRLITDFSRHRSFYYWYRNWRAAVVTQLRRKPKLKTGWTSQARDWSESSVFDTWFRSLTIAEICCVLTDMPYAGFPWKFLSVPGLGWFSRDL